MSKIKKRTVLQHAINNVGGYNGSKAVAHALCWHITRGELGRPPTVEQYADSWKVSRATAYRERANFRLAFPEFASPTELADFVLGVNSVRRPVRTPRAFGQLELPDAA